jgi:hypothetical protein
MPVAAMAFRLEAVERKLLPACAQSLRAGRRDHDKRRRLINSLRTRGVQSIEIENALEGNGATEAPFPVTSKPDWGLTRMPWDQHKGSLFMDIPSSYLRWALNAWRPDTPGRKELLEAIKNFLNQSNA